MTKSVVITGSTRGIGYGLAQAFLARDCWVTLSGRTQAAVDKAEAGLSAHNGAEKVLGVVCDVTDYAQVQALWKAAKDRFGQVDIWINNAGVSNPSQEVWKLSPADYQAVVTTNLIGALNGAKAAITGMLEQGSGSLYNMEGYGSGGSSRRMVGMAPYGATKAGLAFLTASLAVEVKNTPVIVCAIRPGMVATDLVTKRLPPEDLQRMKGMLSMIAERVETVTPWIADKILANHKNGVVFSYSSTWKILGRFLMSPFRKRNVF